MLQRGLLIGIALAVLALTLLAAHWRPLWYDELFTFYVARQPTAIGTVQALLAGADTNPPLDYLLRHAAMALLGASSAAFRLPSALAFIAGLLATYAFVRRRVPFIPAVMALLLPVATAAVYFAYEGRAYALLFASGTIALLAWQRAIERPADRLRLATFTLALCLGPFSHYYGVLSLVPPVLGEASRTWSRRRVDPGIIVAFAAAALLMALLLPFARTATSMQAAFWAARFSLADAYQYFTGFLQYAGSSAVIVLVAALALVPLALRRSTRASMRVDVPVHELVAAITLAYIPLFAFLLGRLVTGALTTRYAIAFVPGLAILAAWLFAMVQPTARTAVLILVAFLAGSSLWHLGSAALAFRGTEPIPSVIRSELARSSLPVAFDSPHLYLEYVHYAPELAATRFVYPMDAAIAARLRGSNNDEIALRGLSQIVPLRVVDYGDFARHSPEFLALYSTIFAPALVLQLKADGFCEREILRSGHAVLLHVEFGCR